jgi:nitrite reductase/ring-hydroxylating ferredoxin subunit
MLSEEEKKLEELRKRTEAEKKRRIIAQQIADQRSQERRKKKELEEIEAKKTKEERQKEKEGAGQETNATEKRSNPLSVAQKYVASLFESQNDKEEWLVVAPKTRISPGEMVPVTAAGLDLLLVASKDGSALYCIANSCPHLGTPLEVGTLERRPIETSTTSNVTSSSTIDPTLLRETDIANLLKQDGCEDCIVCPLHRTAFALESGEVRGEWCPYPPVIGKVMGTVKTKSTLPVFDVRTRGKNIEVRLNTPLKLEENED